MPRPLEDRATRDRFVQRAVDGAKQATLAEEFEVCVRTVRNWLKRPAIKKRIAELSALVFETYARALASELHASLKVTVALRDSGEAEAVRLAAARSIMDRGEKLAELHREAAGTAGPPPVVDVSKAELYEELCGILRRHPEIKDGPTPASNGNGRFIPPTNGRTLD